MRAWDICKMLWTDLDYGLYMNLPHYNHKIFQLPETVQSYPEIYWSITMYDRAMDAEVCSLGNGPPRMMSQCFDDYVTTL